jgi:hypothetical protein
MRRYASGLFIDLKPRKVMIVPTGAKLLNVGIARVERV